MATLAVRIDPDVSGARVVRRSLDDIKNAARDTEGATTKLGRSANDNFRQMGVGANLATKAMGQLKTAAVAAASAFASIAVGAVFAGSIREFSRFEQGLIGVGKTADISGAALQSLGKDIQAIAREVPIATTELLGIAQAAGQLGVSGNDNILAFTATVGKLGLASDLAGEQAATSLARILTVTGTAVGDVDRLGSTIVQLGNNFAATESEIAASSTRVAQATAQFGISASEVAGIGAALTAVGVEAEAGGSVIGRAFQSINDAVRQGGEEMAAFTAITGMTQEALRSLFLEDPTAAFQALVEGLGRINEQGGDVTAALDAVGLEGVRVTSVLGTLATRSDVLADAVSQANAEWETNTALNIEAATATQALAAQTQLLWNAVSEAGVALGEMIAPALTAGIKGLTTVFQTLAENMQRLATYAATAAVAGMVAFRVAIASAATAAWGFVTALVATRAALVRTGIGALIVLAGELVYQFMALVDRSGGFAQAMVRLGDIGMSVWEGLKLGGEALGDILQAVAARIQAAFMRAWVSILESFSAMINAIAGPLANIGIDIGAEGIAGAVEEASRAAAMKELTGSLKEAEGIEKLKSAWNGVSEAIAGTSDAQDAVSEGFNDINGAEPGIVDLGGALDGVGGSLDGVGDSASKAAGGISEAERALEDFISTADRLAEEMFPGEYARREAEELAASLEAYGSSLDSFQLQAVEQEIQNLNKASDMGLRNLEDRASEASDSVMSTLGQTLAGLFDGPIESMDQFFDELMSGFAQIGQANMQSAFDGLLGGGASTSASGDPIGALAGAVEGGAKKGTETGAGNGIFAGLGALFGGGEGGQMSPALSGMLSAGLGGLGVGYQTQDPLMGAIGGAMQGWGAGAAMGGAMGPIGAVVGGIAGFIGGMMGASKALKEAQAKLASMRGEIENFIDVGQGRGLGEMTKAFREVKDQALEYEEIAQEADDFELYDQIQDSVNSFFDYLNTDFMLGFQGTIDALRSGQGMGGAFVTAQQEITDLREELKGFVADTQFMGDELSRLSGKDESEATARRVEEARDAAQQYALSILAGADAQTEYEDATAAARGQASALQVTLEQLGMDAEEAAHAIDGALNVALAKLRDEYVSDLTSSINDLSGMGFLNEIMDAQAQYQDRLRDAAALGLDGSGALQELNLSLADILQSAGLSSAELEMLAEAFPLVSGLIDTLAGQEAMQTVADAKADLQRAYEDEISIIDSTISRLERFTESIRDFRAEMRLDDSSPLSQQDQMEEALRQFRETAALAMGGDEEAQDQLTSVSQAALDEARAYYASSEAYADIWREIDQTLAQVETSAGRQLTEAQRQLDLLDRQVGALIDIDDSVMSVEAAIANLTSAMANSQDALSAQIAAMQNASTSAIEAAYQTNLGRSADASGMDYYQDQISQGKSVDRVVAEIADSPEAKIRELYRDIFGREADAAGLSFYANSGKSIEQIAAEMEWAKANGAFQSGGFTGMGGVSDIAGVVHGQEYVMNAPSTRSIGPQNLDYMNRTGRMPGNDNSDVVAELRALRQDNAQLVRAVERMGTVIGLSDEETRELIRNGNETQADVASELRKRSAA